MNNIEIMQELIDDLEGVTNKQVKKFILNEIGNIVNNLMEEVCQEN